MLCCKFSNMFTRLYHVNLIGETFTALFMMFPNLQHLKFKTPKMKLSEANIFMAGPTGCTV